MLFVMPPWGEAASEADVRRVYVTNGASVNEEDLFLAVATEKVDFELGAPISGIVGEIYVRDGDKIRVGDKIATIYSGNSYDQTAYTIYTALRKLRTLDPNLLDRKSVV